MYVIENKRQISDYAISICTHKIKISTSKGIKRLDKVRTAKFVCLSISRQSCVSKNSQIYIE